MKHEPQGILEKIELGAGRDGGVPVNVDFADHGVAVNVRHHIHAFVHANITKE